MTRSFPISRVTFRSTIRPATESRPRLLREGRDRGRVSTLSGDRLGGSRAQYRAVCERHAEVAFTHVRSESATIRARLVDGYVRSEMFRRLVDEIERLTGIVYIDETVKLSQHKYGALLHAIGGSRQMPILRVMIKSNLAGDYAIAVLAHELQHVVETLQAAPSSGPAMGSYFASVDREASTSKFETEEARRVTTTVLDELRASRKR